MHQFLVRSRLLTMHSYWAATEPIGGVGDSIPVHPEDKHPSFDQHKNRRKPTPDQPSENPNKSHPDSDHQIDEYAGHQDGGRFKAGISRMYCSSLRLDCADA